MIGPLNQALTHGGRQVISTAYQELQAFFTRVEHWTAPGEQVLAGPLSDLAALLTEDRNAIEMVRKDRAAAILTYLTLRRAVRDVPNSWETMLKGWRAGERSSAVSRILDEALALL